MEVILKENVSALGKKGATVRVSDGYARNYLIPKGLAIEASARNVKALEQTEKNTAKKAEKEKKEAELLAERLANVACTIYRKAGDQEKLFGSVTAKDIETALAGQGISIDRKKIILKDAIKAIGDFPVKIKLDQGITAEVTITVAGENE